MIRSSDSLITCNWRYIHKYLIYIYRVFILIKRKFITSVMGYLVHFCNEVSNNWASNDPGRKTYKNLCFISKRKSTSSDGEVSLKKKPTSFQVFRKGRLTWMCHFTWSVSLYETMDQKIPYPSIFKHLHVKFVRKQQFFFGRKMWLDHFDAYFERICHWKKN